MSLSRVLSPLSIVALFDQVPPQVAPLGHVEPFPLGEEYVILYPKLLDLPLMG